MSAALVIYESGVATVHSPEGRDGPLPGYVLDMDMWRNDLDSLEKMEVIVELQDYVDLVPEHIKQELEAFSGSAL